jgi:hypothetical protein
VSTVRSETAYSNFRQASRLSLNGNSPPQVSTVEEVGWASEASNNFGSAGNRIQFV